MSNSDQRMDPRQQNRSSSVIQLVVCVGILAVAVKTGRWLKSAPDSANSQASTPFADSRDLAQASMAETHLRIKTESALPTYITYCAKCHGPDGHGDPESLVRLNPPPRDFAGNNWRFARTGSEIERVIREGIPDTAMPAMGHLFSKDQLQALSQHVLQLSQKNRLSVQHKTPTDMPNNQQAARWQSLQDAGFQVFPDASSSFEMQLLTADRSRVSLSEFSGKAVLLNFWGTSCVHCLKEMPAIAELQRDFSERGLVVVSVCADEEDPAAAATVAAEFTSELQVYVDATGLGLHQAAVTSLPAFLLLDADHRLVARRSGALDWSAQNVRTAVSEILRQADSVPPPSRLR